MSSRETVKVAELEGPLLDLLVALAMGERRAPAHPDPNPDTGRYWLQQGEYGTVKECPRYSTDWAAGGPIIERERIGVADDSPISEPGSEWVGAIDLMPVPDGYGCASFEGAAHRLQRGATPLIAAMRTYVASKFGEECPVPSLRNFEISQSCKV